MSHLPQLILTQEFRLVSFFSVLLVTVVPAGGTQDFVLPNLELGFVDDRYAPPKEPQSIQKPVKHIFLTLTWSFIPASRILLAAISVSRAALASYRFEFSFCNSSTRALKKSKSDNLSRNLVDSCCALTS